MFILFDNCFRKGGSSLTGQYSTKEFWADGGKKALTRFQTNLKIGWAKIK